MATKSTSSKVAKKASQVLTSDNTGKTSKSVAGSVLSQVDSKKGTSKNVATSASKVLRDGRTGSVTKSVAGSALSQTKKTSGQDKGTNSGGPRKTRK